MASNNPFEKKASLGANLRKERLERGWSQKELAERIGVPDHHTVGRWERNVQFPGLFYRKKLAELFGKSLEELGLLDAPATRPSGFNITNHPATFTSLIGRTKEVKSVCEMLTGPELRLLTLLGRGGIGKTRLALAAAELVKDNFADGFYFVPLATLSDPISVIPAIADALSIHNQNGLTLEAQVKYFLREKESLLLLDNFEHVIKAAPFIEELLLACPRTKVLVTSRQVLHLQMEQEFVVPPLSLPDLKHLPQYEELEHYPAIALFVQRAQMHLPSFVLTKDNAPAIVELCYHLDGLPLAIELAAARIKLFQPQWLLKRPRLELLHILKDNHVNVPERHLTLASTIKWSYDLLDEQEQWLFRHLSVFVGGATLTTIEAFFSTSFPSSQVIEIVDSLLSKSLLERVEQENGEQRFLMLETLRSFATESLLASGELEGCWRSFAVYAAKLVEEAEPHLKRPEQAVWLKKLQLELDNLRAALRWLIEQQETALALRFCEAFGKFCGLGGYWLEERHWLEMALLLPGAEQQPDYCRVQRRAGHLAYRLRNLPEARMLLEQSIVHSRQQGDWSNLAGALSGLAWVLYRQKEIQQVDALLTESVEYARQSGDSWSLANSLESQGRYLLYQEKIDDAYRCLEESINIARLQLDPECVARVLTTLVKLELGRGNTDNALQLAQESFQLAQALHTTPLIALTLDILGEVARARRAFTQARRYYEGRLELADELGDTPSIERTRHILEQIEQA